MRYFIIGFFIFFILLGTYLIFHKQKSSGIMPDNTLSVKQSEEKQPSSYSVPIPVCVSQNKDCGKG